MRVNSLRTSLKISVCHLGLRLFLTVPQTDYLVVHWFVFVFDLTVAVWMMLGRTRHVAMIFCALFHLMNSRLFSIGMFPWVCLATMPLFYPFDWPKNFGIFLYFHYFRFRENLNKYSAFTLKHKNVKCDQEDAEYKKDDRSMNTSQPVEGVIDSSNIDDNKSDENIEKEKDKPFDLVNADEKDNEAILNAVEDHYEVSEGICTNEITEGVYTKNTKNTSNKPKDANLRIITVTLIVGYVFLQAFLPFSHFITQGYNNWTKGLYGYSWDMMVHTWETHSVVVKIVDNEKNAEFFLDPYMYSPNERWTRHGDMLYQYANCLRDNLLAQKHERGISRNISVYIDVWVSMNGRFTQRMFDSKADLLAVSWSPFEPMSYLMPLLDEALDWRSVLQDIKQEVHTWNAASDVIFMADFPGYDQEKYISSDLDNVTLTILEGVVVYEPEVSKTFNGKSYQLATGDRMKLSSGIFHRIINIGENPAYYMYTFVNTTDVPIINKARPKLPIVQEMSRRINSMATFAYIVLSNIFNTCLQLTQCQ